MMSPEAENPNQPPAKPAHEKGLAALPLFALCCLILLLASLQVHWPGKWWRATAALSWPGQALKLVQGKGYNLGKELKIDGLTGSGVALAVLSQTAFPAADYPVVHWAASRIKPGGKLEFLWRTSENPDKIFAHEIEWIGNSTAPLHMAGDSNWQGQITELMLGVNAPLDTPLTIAAVRVEPPLAVVWREWFGAEPWLGTSVHFMGGNEVRHWLGPLSFAAASLALAMLAGSLWLTRKSPAARPGIMFALFFVAWLALDLRWQIDLGHKLSLTQQRFSGKTWEEKHLAAEDGPLFYLMQKIRAKLSSTQRRIFLFADDEYIRGRAAYHLYPFNVLNAPDLLPPGQYKPGDYIVILGKDEVKFDAVQRLLKWGANQQIRADLLLLAENNVLLEVR